MRILVSLAAVSLLFVGCTPHKKIVSQYNYLIKEEHSKTLVEATKPSASPEIKPKAKENAVETALIHAQSFVGTPYRYGGTSRKGIDCSGLVQSAYNSIGVTLPRTTSLQVLMGEKVPLKSLKKGDLVFFDAQKKGKISHVGMVSEVNSEKIVFIHASVSGGVRYDRLDTGYWAPRYKTARRVVTQ